MPEWPFGLEHREDGWWPGDWSITVVKTHTPVYLLQIPCLKSLIKPTASEFMMHYPEVLEIAKSERFIELSAREYSETYWVARRILEATGGEIDVRNYGTRWSHIWHGTRETQKRKNATIGLKSRLISNARLIDVHQKK